MYLEMFLCVEDHKKIPGPTPQIWLQRKRQETVPTTTWRRDRLSSFPYFPAQ